ncbi:MAG: hypothetical protein JO264_05145 [Acidisphaera sp.]|nr:hypothetical protein [Acidisphaera sp.]
MQTTQLVGGLAGAIGCDFLPAQNRLLFVEYGGKLSKLDLFPAMSVVSQGTTELKGTFLFDLDNGTESLPGQTPPGADIWWNQATAVVRSMAPSNSATIINLGVTPFASVLPQSLPGLSYATTPIDGNDDPTNKLVTNDVFAVRTTAGNYAKVLVTSYGYNIGLQWVTYQAASAYSVLGTGYLQPEDVVASADGVHAYVIERAGNLLRVPLASANRANAAVVSSGMTAPQQMVLDEPHGFAYVVEYAASGRLLKISLANGAQTVLLNGLNFAVGLAMSADGQTAYVTEQTSNATAGAVNRYALPGGGKTVLASGLTSPFFLEWSDDTETTLYLTERSPANTVLSVGVTAPASKTVIASGLANMPSCIAVVHPGTLLVTTDQTIEEATFGLNLTAGAPLVAGIGFVPFNFIVGGFANTASDPSNVFQVSNAPFAGSLPVMVNFLEAIAVGAAYYQVITNGTDIRTDQYNTTYAANGVDYTPAVFQTQTINGQPYYKVPTLTELELWYPGLVGCYLDSTTLPNATTSTIAVKFYDAGMNLLTITPAPATMTVYIDNSPAKAGISLPVLNGVSATTACGYLQYKSATKATDQISLAYTASQPQGHANYSFELVRGVTGIGSAGGPVSTPPAPYQATVANLLGTCTIAGFAAEVYVATTATTGWGRAGGLDASALIAFVLAPG